MPQAHRHVPQAQATGPAAERPLAPQVGGRGNAAEAERLRARVGESGAETEQAVGAGPTAGARTEGAEVAAPTEGPAGGWVLARGAAANRAGLATNIERVEVWAGLWEMPFSRAWVRLATGAEGPTVVLDWPSAVWGAPPQARDLTGTRMQAFEARWAVKHAHDSEGWRTLDGTNQARLDAVLGGETNDLSSRAQGEMRRALMAGFKTKPAEEQATFLSDLVTGTSSRPMLVAEDVSGSRAQLTRAGPTEVTGHTFASGAADALRYVLTWPDGASIEVFVPKSTDPTLGYHTVAQVEEAVAFLPEANRKGLEAVQINPARNPLDTFWAREYGRVNFRSYMTAGVAGVVDIYPSENTASLASQRTVTGTMQHETGHVWSQRTWGTDRTQGRWVDWRAAMQSDRVSVSSYAGEDIQEDVAETVQAYGTTKGAPAHEEYRRMVPARFTILDADLK